MDLGLSGHRAVVTGAAAGIGGATARFLLDDGASVLLTDLDGDQLAETARFLTDDFGDRVSTVVADLTTEDGVAALKKAAPDGVDVLVHTCGITGAKGDPLDDITDDDWLEAWQTDFMSGVRVARAFVPAMRRAGWGRVVFVTSENVAQPYSDEAVYNAAKAAVLTLAKAMAQRYAPDGVLVNSVAPAFIATDMTEGMMAKTADEEGITKEQAIENFLEDDRPHLVLNRRGRPEEVAAVIAFLCSERASFVVGANYRVDGGSVASIDL